MQYVLVERMAGQVAQAEVRRLVEAAGARVLRWRGHLGLVEFEGAAHVLVERAGGLPGWLVSESRTYRLASEQNWHTSGQKEKPPM
jgi:hypothetical protein